MPEYIVKWEIELQAKNPESAAREALSIQRDRDSLSTVFDVVSIGDNSSRRVDLTQIDQDARDTTGG